MKTSAKYFGLAVAP